MTVDKNILSIIENIVPFPTFILDEDGRIIDFNQKGKKFLPDATFNTLIYEILDKEFARNIERMIYKAKSYDKTETDNLILKHENESEEYQITVSPYTDEIQSTYICTIRKITKDKHRKELQKFTIVTEEIDKIIRDEELFEIVKSVKSAFPFTFIGKAKIQKQIDMLEGFFWIKDGSRRFILVNQRFANILGVKSKQLEGRFEKDVLSHFQNKLFATIDNYILETTNTVIIDGMSTSSPYGEKPYEIIEFPILDIDNNVVAIIGISQIGPATNGKPLHSAEVIYDVLKSIDYPFISVDRKGKIEKASPKSIQYFNQIDNITGKNILELLENDNQKEEITKFLEDRKLKQVSIKLSKTVELISLRELKHDDKFLFLLKDSNKTDSKTAGILKMYDAIMKISPQAMFIYDVENLKFMEVNDAATKLYGYSRDEFLNMDLTDLYAPEDIQTLLETANKKSASNEFTGPWRHMKKDGSSVIVEQSKSELDYKGKSAHITIIRDITQEITDTKKIKLFRTAFENTSDLIFITDKDGFVTYASEPVLRSLEYSKKDLDKKPILSLLKDESRAEFNKEVIHSDSKETKKLKTSLKKANGEYIEANLAANSIYDFNGEKESITIIAKPKEKVKEVVKERSVTAEKSGIEPSFLSNVFHELLTPINVILGFTQEINDSLDEPTSDQKEAIDIINENQKLLMQTMDTAAEYSALEDNKIQFKPEEIVFVDLLEEIQSTTDRTARSNNLELTYGKISSSLKLTTDKHHFTILITQFIKYAMQISKESKLYLSAYTYDDDKCLISVKDKREGITTNLLEGLEEIFTKDEDAIRKSLGFSRITTKLFRKLIISLNAQNKKVKREDRTIEYGIIFPSVLKIEYKDVKDQLSDAAAKEREEKLRKTIDEEPEAVKSETVIEKEKVEEPEQVEVKKEPVPQKTVETEPKPKEPVPQPTPNITKEREPREKKPVTLEALKCLCVEDQVDSQILFKVQMKELQEIEFAASFEEALPKIKSKEFDFIVMDINLEGEYNGLDALRVIQKLPGYHNTPVIAVTAYVLPGDRDKFIAAGFSDFISKPVLKDKLVNSLEKIL